MVKHEQHMYSGPIPPPQILAGYAEILPSAPERILAMAEKNAQHIRDMEAKSLDADIAGISKKENEIKRGQLCAFGVVVLFIGLAGYALKLGHPTTAGIIGTTGVIGIVGLFITGRNKKSPSASPKETLNE